MSFITDHLLVISFVLSLAINVLQFVAPRTKNKIDDAALEGLEAAQGLLPKEPPKAPPKA